MSSYFVEFLGLMAVFSVVIVAPGADFAVVVRQAVVHGRRTAIASSIGIGTSLLFHLAYTILGLGLVVSQSLIALSALKWAGAAYLVYLGVSAWRSPAMGAVELTGGPAAPSPGRAFLTGFATNALNPKPVLFFLSLFSALVSPATPIAVEAVYGLAMAASLIGWFVFVSYVFTVAEVRDRFAALGRLFNRVTGAAFVALGLRLAASASR